MAICEAITVVSAGLKQELVSHKIAGEKITVIPNGIDTNQFKILDNQYCRNKLGIETDRPIILYVGRLSEEKNVSTLIKATAALIHGGHNVRLLIVGEGPLKNELMVLAGELGIDSFVRFIGKVGHSQVSLWMGAADYFCLPSIREGCPNVILEALGSGRPVIASRVGAIPDIVTDDSGIMFTPEDVEELTLSLKRAFATEWSPIKIKESVKKLSWEKAAAEYVKIFRQSRIKRPSS